MIGPKTLKSNEWVNDLKLLHLLSILHAKFQIPREVSDSTPSFRFHAKFQIPTPLRGTGEETSV